ncbi:AAA domain-containing protein [Umezawaea tangerina]|uniref:Phospholipase D-like protein n=1 Tax=Umezawaea tangerina TaxID=84725 RepID=A0A2T0S8H9_9PSEU|nr:AAA domain-containing protein [Umezawaea tangerina]PRY29702.1 phospholipase D-like protein [Umezawaea tangerina]
MVAGKRNHPVDDFLRAIGNEIEAQLAGSGPGDGRIGLKDGLLVGVDGSEFDYVFSPVKKWEADAGDRFLVRSSASRRRWERATVAPMPDGKVRVTTAAELGRTPGTVQLAKDETGSSELLAGRVSGVSGSVNRATADLVLGEGAPRIGRCADVDRLIHGYRALALNTRQRMAIEHALASDVTFIWGPPGTGKTEVVCRIVEGCLRQGLKVLFLAPTKIAVDQAVERLCVLLQHEEGFDTGLLQRLGEIESRSLVDGFGPCVSPDMIVAKLAREIDERAAAVESRGDQVRAGIDLHAALSDTARLLGEERDRRTDLTRGAVAGGQVDGELERCRRTIKALERKLAECSAAVSAVEPLAGLRDVDARMTRELAAIQDERRALVDAVRERRRVVATTVAKAIQSRPLMDTVDVVVIDEAGMVALPSAWCAAGLADKRVVIAGDFRQLPAVTHGSTSRTATAEDQRHSLTWMDRDAFTAAGLVDPDGAARSDSRMICLDSQYRMRRAICAVVNEVAYPDSPLRTERDDVSRLPGSRLISGSLVLVDTTSRRIPYSARRRNAHKSNIVHEAVVHELVRGLQFDSVLPTRKRTDLARGERATDRMAVIVPYRDQAKTLRKSLAHRFGEEYDGLVDTVHRFQGSQRPLVVVDTVAGAGDKPGWFYEQKGLSSATCRLLNVALSRAQDHLVVIADVDFLRRAVPADSEVARLVDHLVRHADRLAVDDLVPVRAAADLAGMTADELARPAFFPADEVERALVWDFELARRRIDVYCPFLDRPPVRKWLKRLERRMLDGVVVAVHTRPQDEGSSAAGLVDELHAAGCQVVLRERMHEKVVVIDGTVLWHGSSNLFANTGPTDLMMRITDPAACEQVTRIIASARMERPARPRWPPRPTSSGPPVAVGDVLNGRLYLNVPRGEKDEAKDLVEARWDRDRGLWHVDADTPRAKVRRWLPGEPGV